MTTIKNLGSIALTLSAVGLLPNLAQAQCTPAAPAAGPGADTLACVSSAAANVYGPSGTNGIVFTSSGDLTVNLTGSAATNLGVGGLSLTAGDADDNLTLNRSGGAISGTGNTAPAVVRMQTQNGDIRIDTTGNIAGNAANVQYGIHAQALGTGDIHISSSATGTATISTGTAVANPGVAAIFAQSNGGDVRIESTGAGVGNVGLLTATGRQYGVLASTTGSGSLHFRGNASASAAAGIAALDLSTQTGLLTVDLVGTGSTSNARSQDAVGIRLTTQGGDAVINRLGNGSVSAGGSAAGNINIDTTAIELNILGGTTTINNLSTSGSFGQSNPNQRADGLLRAHGTGSILFNNSGGAIYGRFDLSDFDGNFSLDNTATGTGWFTYGLNVLSGGDNAISNAAGSVLVMGSTVQQRVAVDRAELVATVTTLRFGEGHSTVTNGGTLLLGQLSTKAQLILNATTVAFEELTAFENAGNIVFGQYSNPDTPFETDGFHDDILDLRGAHFSGAAGSRLFMDVLFNGTGQSDCARVTTLAHEQVLSRTQVANGEGFLPGADCMDVRGGRVSGQTEIFLSEAFAGDRGAYNPDGTVLVDVRGGVVDSADAFVLSTDIAGYSTDLGGVIDKGAFIYALGFESDASGEGGQFKLYGVEAPGTQQFPLLAHAASDLWRGTTASWTDRRRAQRDGEAQNELARGIWLRGGASSVDRTVHTSVAVGDSALAFDNSHTQNNSSLTFGVDIGRLSVGSGDWTLGAMFGYARARVGYDASVNDANFEGAHLGVYGSFTSGRFFHDLVVNTTMLNLDNDIPSLNLRPAGTVLSTDVRTNGARLDTGWRFEPMERMQLVPMLSVEWLKTGFEQLRVPADDPVRLGANIDYEDSRSLRAGLGLRLGMKDVLPSLLPVDVSLSWKSMRESDGEAVAVVENVGPIAPRVGNTLDGTFNEVGGTMTLGSRSGAMTGYIHVQSIFGKDYNSLGGSAGFRLQW